MRQGASTLRSLFRRSWFHRLLLVAGALVLYATPLAIPYFHALLDHPSVPFLTACAGIAALLVAAQVAVQAAAPRFLPWLAWAIALPLLAWASLSLVISWYIRPLFACAALLGALTALLRPGRLRRGLLLGWVLLFLPLLAATAAHVPRLATTLWVYTALLALLLGSLWVFRVLDAFPRQALFAFLLSAPTLCLNGWFYLGVTPEKTEEVLAQPGVRCLFTYVKPWSPLVRAIGPSTFWVTPAPSPGEYVVGTRITARLIQFSPEQRGQFRSLDLYHDRIIDMIDGVSDALDFAAPGGPWFLGYRSRLIKLDPADFQVLAEAPVPRNDVGSGMVNIVRLDRKHNRVLCMVDVDRYLYFHDAGTLEPLHKMEFPDHLWDFLVDEAGNQIIVSSTGLGGSLLRFYDLDTLALTGETRPGWSFAYMCLDPAGRRVFGASTVSGDLVVVDADRREVLSRIPVEPGIRYPVYDPHRNLVYVGGYSRGTLSVVDPDGRGVLARYELGFRVRSVLLSETTGKVTVTSSTGAFEIDPDARSTTGTGSPG